MLLHWILSGRRRRERVRGGGGQGGGLSSSTPGAQVIRPRQHLGLVDTLLVFPALTTSHIYRYLNKGSGGSPGRVVGYQVRGPRFESQSVQIYFSLLFRVHAALNG
ncbi:hypothetical protein PoB_005218800 [Plakobranchus ocellatus]|uniref:Uncharacterized protein n=1 Tax=Plakobranchus ocellatus TaxID=259542 RepID=A0AAV4C2Q5_9GAST|nr:hypothetical protein PoB_005218800 [Plakobranchus ocellatus]